MNTVEDRLRDALAERAAHSPVDPVHPVDPDAWQQTLARVRRRPTQARTWSRFGIPLAAAAAVVAIVVGAALLTRGGGGAERPASRGTSARPAPPGPGNYLIQQNPPISAIVPVKMTIDGQVTWTFVWFGYMKGHRSLGVYLCSVTDGGNFYGGGGCDSGQVPARQVAVSSGGSGPIREGVSVGQVTSVTAQLPGGRSVPGVVVSGRGFPAKVWLVSYPSADNAQLVFRDASGTEVEHLTEIGADAFPSRPDSGGIRVFHYPAGTLDATGGWMTAYLLRDGRVGFWSAGNAEPMLSSGPASGPPAVGTLGGGYVNGAKVAEFFGYAHQNVARVVLRLGSGAQYSAQTRAAWPGLRLWDFFVPTDRLRVKPGQDIMLGYDAAGQVVWQLRASSS